MSNPVAVKRTLLSGNDENKEHQVLTWCPGCESLHPFTVQVEGNVTRQNGSPRPVWDWDGNLERPTFSPSMLCYSSVHICKGEHPPEPCPDYDTCEEKFHQVLNPDWFENGAREYGHPSDHTKDPAWGNCHSFLRNGVWEFLGDSAHSLAGQSVPMVPLPDWVLKRSGVGDE